MKVFAGVAFAVVVLIAGFFIWNQYRGLKAAEEMKDVNFDVACAEAYVRVGQSENSEGARSELDVCEKAGWKPPQ